MKKIIYVLFMLFISFWLINNTFALSESKKESLVKVLEKNLYKKIENKSISTQETTLNKLIAQINKLLPKATWEKKELLEFLKEELNIKINELDKSETTKDDYILFPITDAFPDVSVIAQADLTMYYTEVLNYDSNWAVLSEYQYFINHEDINISSNKRYIYFYYWATYNLCRSTWCTYYANQLDEARKLGYIDSTKINKKVQIFDTKTWELFKTTVDKVKDNWKDFYFVVKNWNKEEFYINSEKIYSSSDYIYNINLDLNWIYSFYTNDKIILNWEEYNIEWDKIASNYNILISKDNSNFIYASLINKWNEKKYCVFMKEWEIWCYYTQILNLDISNNWEYYSFNTKWWLWYDDKFSSDFLGLFSEETQEWEKHDIVRILNWKKVSSFSNQDLSKYNESYNDNWSIELDSETIVDDISMKINDGLISIYKDWELLFENTTKHSRFLWKENNTYDKNYKKPENIDVLDYANYSWKTINSVSISDDLTKYIIITDHWFYFHWLLAWKMQDMLMDYDNNNWKIFHSLYWDTKNYYLNLDWFQTIYFNK